MHRHAIKLDLKKSDVWNNDKMNVLFKILSGMVLITYLNSCGSSTEESHDHNHEHGHGHSHAQGEPHSHDSENNSHESEKPKGPNGGRLVDTETIKYEVLILDDRSVEIRILDQAFEIIPHSVVSASIIAGDRTAPTEISFSPKDEKTLLSHSKLPEGDKIPVIVTIHHKESGKEMNVEKFYADMTSCPTCPFLEYACICND